MSLLGGSVEHEKKLETAKEKKEQADKAFQASDLPAGTTMILFFISFIVWRHSTRLLIWEDSFEVLS